MLQAVVLCMVHMEKCLLKENFISMHLTTPCKINKMAGEMYCNFYHQSLWIKYSKLSFF